jgi:hypothetical protein
LESIEGPGNLRASAAPQDRMVDAVEPEDIDGFILLKLGSLQWEEQ